MSLLNEQCSGLEGALLEPISGSTPAGFASSPVLIALHRIFLAAVLATTTIAASLPSPASAEDISPSPARTQLISLSQTPPAPADQPAADSSTSADGRFVVFATAAKNVSATPSTNGIDQIYLRDTRTGMTALVTSARGIPGNGSSMLPAVSDDGSVVAFLSLATNLAPGSTGTKEAFVWSRSSGEISMVSVSNAAGNPAANSDAQELALARDGHSVAFSTLATNLVPAPTFGFSQIYKRDLIAGRTDLVSVPNDDPASGARAGTGDPSLSSDGRYVIFGTSAALTATSTGNRLQIYRRDTASYSTELVSISRSGSAAANSNSFGGTSSADGRYIAFQSWASDLTTLSTAGSSQIYIRDMQLRTNRLISTDASRTKGGNADSKLPSISADGRSVAYVSAATDIVPQGTQLADSSQIYLFDKTRPVASVVSVGTGGEFADYTALAYRPSTADGGLVVFTSAASNLLGTPSAGTAQVYLRNTNDRTVTRIGGADRFAVSAATSEQNFATGVPVVYIASGSTFADALSGSAAAGNGHGPVLLVTSDTIPTPVAMELTRLKPQKIIILGGTDSVQATVATALAAYSSDVERIAGADRYEVSAAISATTFKSFDPTQVKTVYVASGEVFPDALSAGAATAGKAPVLLVTRDRVPNAVTKELARIEPDRIVVLGGTNTISESVVSTLSSTGQVTRIGGADRFAVSAAAAADFPVRVDTVYVASGAVFPDALSGSAAAIQNKAPVLLVTADSIPAPVAAELSRLQPSHIVVLGGSSTVSETVFEQLIRLVAT